MKAISLRQPYASLWVTGAKVCETRAYRIFHRGWLLVHASTWSDFALLDPKLRARLDEGYQGWRDRFARGGIIGAVRVTRMDTTGLAGQIAAPDELLFGDYSPGRWAWRTDSRVEFESAIKFKGKLGLFNVPDQLIVERDPLAWGIMQ